MMFADRSSVYVVAEISSNAGGSLDAALALIDAAAHAGANAAKFQAGHADHVYNPAQFPEEHASFKKYLEPVLGWLPKLAQRCSERGIDFGCSAFCLDALDAVDSYVKWHKVASIESEWTEYVRAVEAKKKPTLISTGMRDFVTVGPFHAERWGDIVFMGCTTSYPCALEDAHVRSAEALSHGGYANGPGYGVAPRDPIRFLWGLSDHTTHPTIAPCAAVALGAQVIEKHMRLDYVDALLGIAGWITKPNVVTPDTAHSINQWAFKDMVEAIRLTEKVLGSPEKRIRKSERPYLKYRRGPKGLRGA